MFEEISRLSYSCSERSKGKLYYFIILGGGYNEKTNSKRNYCDMSVDGDGTVTSSDAVMIQKYLAGIIDLDDVQKSVVDTNGDGKINIFDATRIQKYVAGVIDEL